MTDIIVPTLGESVSEATVGTWLKKAGDAVSKDEVIVELETDKVSVEVAAPEDGVLSEIVAAEGETVGIGALLGKVGAGDGAAAAPAPAEETSEAPKEEAAAPAASGTRSQLYAVCREIPNAFAMAAISRSRSAPVASSSRWRARSFLE